MASQFPDAPPPPDMPPRHTPPTGPGTGLVERAKNIIVNPRGEWQRIDAEPATVGGIVTGYVVPLAAIGPLASILGGLIFGYGSYGLVVFRPSLSMLVTAGVVSYVLAIVGIWVTALVIDGLAPSFDGQRDPVQAMKVAAYSATPGWLAGVFLLVPGLGILQILGLYGLFLLWLGLPLLMRVPEAKAVGYTVVTLVVGLVVFLVVGALAGVLTSRLLMPTYRFGGGAITLSGTAVPSAPVARVRHG